MDQKKAGVLLSYGQTVLSTLISLVYTPVMLRLLGQSEYGTYTLVNGFISNLSLMSFGLGSAYVRYFARYEASDGEDGVAKINGMFMVIFLVIGVLSLFVGGILVANVHNIFAAKLTPAEVETAASGTIAASKVTAHSRVISFTLHLRIDLSSLSYRDC